MFKLNDWKVKFCYFNDYNNLLYNIRFYTFLYVFNFLVFSNSNFYKLNDWKTLIFSKWICV